MVYRIYVEKKPGFDVEAEGLKNELVSLLGIQSLNGLRLLNRYDVEGIDEALFHQCATTVFSEPPVDNTYDTLPQDGRRVLCGGVPARSVRPARRFCRRVHPAHQPGRAPAGPLRQGLPAAGRSDRRAAG